MRRFVFGEPDSKSTRNKVLQFLKDDIERRLASSLHNLVKLDLFMEDQRQQVGQSTLQLVPEDVPAPQPDQDFLVNRVLQPDDTAKPIPLKQTKIIEVFERPDINHKLLILGEPGSGKTTELLHLAQELTSQAIDDVRLPIPVILEVSAWKGETIEGWVASQLKKRFNLQLAITQQWLDSNQLLLLLDGLDELGLTNQSKYIEAINTFIEQHRPYGLVVCCRREEYEAGQTKLNSLNGAVYLEALTEAQVEGFFSRLNRLSLWETVSNDPVLLELARKPLFLFMLVVAYQGQTIGDEAALFEAYIQKQLHESSNQGTYPKDKGPTAHQTCHYLIWLARHLERIEETEFLIEELQPDCLTARQGITYRVISELVFGLGVGLMFGLGVGLMFGLGIGLSVGFTSGVSVGLIYGLTGGPIEPIETITFSRRKGLIGVLIGGPALGLSFALIYELLRGELMFGLISGLIFGLMGGPLYGLSGGAVEDKTTPNQGIWRSCLNSLRIGPILVLIFVLIFVLTLGLVGEMTGGRRASLGFLLRSGILSGMIGGFMYGLTPVIRHFVLRLLLTQNNYTPWNYARFLDHAVKHRFIQKTGGRYRFVHDRLRKHFAAMPLETR